MKILAFHYIIAMTVYFPPLFESIFVVLYSNFDETLSFFA